MISENSTECPYTLLNADIDIAEECEFFECGMCSEEGVACTVQCKHFNTCTRNPYKNKTTK